MISVNYVNNGCNGSHYNDDCSSYLNYLEHCLDDIYTEYADIAVKNDILLLESSIMEEEIDNLVLEDANKNFIEKIGAKIIEMGKKLTELINKIIDKLKSISFQFKSNEKKMNLLMKEHPELAKEKIQILCSEGQMDFSDFKSLAELDKEFEKVLRMAKEKDVDPNTIRGKWNKAMKKWFNPDDDKSTKVKKGIATAAAGIALVVAVKELPVQIAKFKNQLTELKNKNNQLDADALEAINKSFSKKVEVLDQNGKKTYKEIPGNVENEMGYATLLLNINRERQGKHAQVINEHQSFITRMQNSIAKAVDKVLDSKPVKSLTGDLKANKITDLRNAQNKADTEFSKELTKIRKQEKAKQKGILDFKISDSGEQHLAALREEEKAKSIARASAFSGEDHKSSEHGSHIEIDLINKSVSNEYIKRAIAQLRKDKKPITTNNVKEMIDKLKMSD